MHSFSGWIKLLSTNIHRDMYITLTVWCKSCTINRHHMIQISSLQNIGIFLLCIIVFVCYSDIHRIENMFILPMYGVYYIGQVNIWVCISYSVNWNAHMMPVRFYDELYAHKFGAVDFFWNITRRQAILPVTKFHHVLGRGFMIQRVILIFIT